MTFHCFILLALAAAEVASSNFLAAPSLVLTQVLRKTLVEATYSGK